MLRATICLNQFIDFKFTAESEDKVRTKIAVQRPEGFEVSRTLLRMEEPSDQVVATGNYRRREQTRELTVATFEELWALTPSGWTVLQIANVP